MNSYDPCVRNIFVKYNQQTICSHVDNWKLSQKDSEVNNKIINTIRDEYESLFEDGSRKMKVNWVKVHKYFGTTLDYKVMRQVNTTMLDYI